MKLSLEAEIFSLIKDLDEDHLEIIQGNRELLQSLSRFIVKEGTPVPRDVASAILRCLIPMGSQILNPARGKLLLLDVHFLDQYLDYFEIVGPPV